MTAPEHWFDGDILASYSRDHDDYDEACHYMIVAARYLCARMSEWSEDRDCSSWHHGIDRTIWLVGTGAEPPPTYWNAGGDPGEPLERAQACVALGRDLNCWWKWHDDEDGPRRVDLKAWLAAEGLS